MPQSKRVENVERPQTVAAATYPNTEGYVAIREDVWDDLLERVHQLEHSLMNAEDRLYNLEHPED